jgi:hypothetical protein
MKFIAKSFPRLQFILLLSIFIPLLSCEQDKTINIDNAQFIEIYSRLLIIYELEVKKDTQHRLIDELFNEYKVTGTDVDSVLNYLNSNPREWVEILAQVRDHIKEIRKIISPNEKDPAVITKPSGPWLKKRPSKDQKKDNPEKKPQEQKIQTGAKR